MEYKTFKMLVKFPNGFVRYFMDLVAVDQESAYGDLKASYGECELISWGHQ